ncbi:hypothetical protein P692DRAFT_20213180 [Suillus brevipes Sb2]|nr:hypothetical protein P692DRAFT_20213180 [Suillus brevipes Sb2]
MNDIGNVGHATSDRWFKYWSGTHSSNASFYCPIRASEGAWTVCTALSMVQGMSRMCRLAHGYWASHKLISISPPSPVFNAMSSERAKNTHVEKGRRGIFDPIVVPPLKTARSFGLRCVVQGVRIFHVTNCMQSCIGTILFGRLARIRVLRFYSAC